MSDEQKRKQSIAMQEWWTPERRKLMSQYLKGEIKTHEEYYHRLQGWGWPPPDYMKMKR